MTDQYDIAIVGYGPVGQALALSMLQRGHRVVVLERWHGLYGMPRAVSLDHEAMRILQALHVTDEFALHTCMSQRYEWRNAAGEQLLVFDQMDRPGLSGWPTVSHFSQPLLERLLDERVRGHSSATVMMGWEVTAIDEGSAPVLRAQPTGQSAEATRSIAARYVVGCDGAGSFVRKAMGGHYSDLGFSADWIVVDVNPLDAGASPSELAQICDPVRPTTLTPGGPGRRRLEFMLLPGEQKSDMNNADVVWGLLARWNWRPDNAELERHAVYTFRGAVASSWRRGPLMLAGDAAHLTPPFAGQGLCAGLRDVAALAWRLDAVLRGQAEDSLLDSYGPERSRHVQAFIEFAIRLGEVICVLDPVVAAMRDHAMLSGQREGPPYPRGDLAESPLLRANDAQAGRLALQARVQLGQRMGLFDDLAGHGFVLLGMDHDPGETLSPEQVNWLARIDVKVLGIGELLSLRDVDGAYARWFSDMGCRTVLIRPDFYLFGAGEAPELVDALRSTGQWDLSEPTALPVESAFGS